MGSGITVEPAAGEGPADGTPHELCTDRGIERCAVADEQGSICTLGSCATQVLYDRPSSRNGQWQHICPSQLPVADCERAFAPVQVIQLNGGYLAGTQPHVGQAARHGVAALPARAVPIKSTKESAYFFRGEMFGQRRQTPPRYRRHRGHQVLDSIFAPRCAVTQVAAQCAANDPCRARAVAIRGADHELHDVGRLDPVELYRSGAETIDQELAHPHPAGCARSWRQSADGLQMRIEAIKFVLNRLRNLCLRFRDTAFTTQYMQKVCECRTHPAHAALTWAWTGARRQVLCHEAVYQQLVDGTKLNPPLGHPVREMLDAMEVGPNSRRAITLILQIADVSVGGLAQNARTEPITI